MTHEAKALAFAVLAGLISLGGAGLMSLAITTNSGSTVASSPSLTVTPELINQGHQYFEVSCSHCHGDDARGDDDGPDLHDLRISNAHIAMTIKKGIKGQMPTFAKKYDDRQIAVIVRYLRSLR